MNIALAGGLNVEKSTYQKRIVLSIALVLLFFLSPFTGAGALFLAGGGCVASGRAGVGEHPVGIWPGPTTGEISYDLIIEGILPIIRFFCPSLSGW